VNKLEKKFKENIKGYYKSNMYIRIISNFMFPNNYKLSNMRVFINDLFKKKYPENNIQNHIFGGMDWLNNAYKKGKPGVSGVYNLNMGWTDPYPETTGYIITTFFDYINYLKNVKQRSNIIPNIYSKAINMANWLVDIQSSDGSFSGGFLNNDEKKPNVFNTGQIMIGLLRAYDETKNEKYLYSAEKAGDWLINSQNRDGTWTKYTYENGSKSYHSRISWPLLILYSKIKNSKYKNSAMKNIDWIIKNQRDNFWFEKTDFFSEKTSLTHTLAYTLEGLLASGIILNDYKLIKIVENTAYKLMRIYEIKKYDLLPALFDENWKPIVNYSCLTGCAQFSTIWSKLFKITGDIRYFNTALKINSSLKMCQILDSNDYNINGGIKGSHPIYGAYLSFSYPNWATKFFIDALILEDKILKDITLEKLVN
jgi:hypothetical protein